LLSGGESGSNTHLRNSRTRRFLHARVIERLERGEQVGRDELQAGSVQIWQNRAEDWGTSDFALIPGLRKWSLPYDPFLGYMAGVLPLIDRGHTGYII
jgi:hypothetical protein